MTLVDLWLNLLDRTDLPLYVAKLISMLMVEVNGTFLSSRTPRPETNALLTILELMRSLICKI
jgi:hypothetical protein